MWPAVLLLLSCSGNRSNTEATGHYDSAVIHSNVTSDTSQSIETAESEGPEDDGCVFSQDYRGLTTEWLHHVGINDFTWRDDIKTAVIVKGADSLYFGRGGCSHMGTSLELLMNNSDHDLNDSTFWANEVLKLSKEFGFDRYQQAISNHEYKVEPGNGSIWFNVEDDDPDDNIIYEGIFIRSEGRSKRIVISEYMN